jgi:hypothetical protein
MMLDALHGLHQAVGRKGNGPLAGCRIQAREGRGPRPGG